MLDDVLIVEDEAITKMELEFIVRCAGYRLIGTAHDGISALIVGHVSHPTVALLDINLDGDGDGIEVGQELNQTFGTQVVFITGCSDETILERAEAIAPVAILHKPVAPVDLISALEHALARQPTAH